MPFTLTQIPGLFDLPDSLLDSGDGAIDATLSKIASNAKFGAVCVEFFQGEFRDGDEVPLPISSADGYRYSRDELIYFREVRATGNPSAVAPSAPGQLLFLMPALDSATGKVSMLTGYYVQGGQQTNTNDGLLALTVIGIRGRAELALAAQPAFTDVAASAFAVDASLKTSRIKEVNRNAKLAAVRAEAFIDTAGTSNYWTASAAKSVGNLVKPTLRRSNGLWYKCIVAGTTGVTEPKIWPGLVGQTIQDGSVTWEAAGFGYSNSQTVPLPVSPIDGYAYGRAEIVANLPFWSFTGKPDLFDTTGAGRIRYVKKTVNSATGVVTTQVNYWNGQTETVTTDGRVGVITICLRTLGTLGAVASPFVDTDFGKFFAGEKLGHTRQQDLNRNAKFSILRPEIFSANYTHGQTVALPVSAHDGYNYVRDELIYLAMQYDTGIASAAIQRWNFRVDPATGAVISSVSFQAESGGISTPNNGTILVVTIARRAHSTTSSASNPTAPTPPPSQLGPVSGFGNVPQSYGDSRVGSGKQSYGASMNASSTTITLSNDQYDTFVAEDAGKTIIVYGVESNDIIRRGGTIVSVTDSTHAVLSFSPPVNSTNEDVFWFDAAQDDAAAIQAAFNAGSMVHFPTGVYVVATAGFTWNKKLRRISGEGRRRSTILHKTNTGLGSTLDFIDPEFLHIKDLLFYGPGINGSYGGRLLFRRINNSNINGLILDNIEVRGVAQGAGIDVDTPILSTFRNIRASQVVGYPIYIKNAVACDLINCYGITCLTAGIYISGGAAIGLQGCAAEVAGVGILVKDAFAVRISHCDCESTLERVPDQPAGVTPTAVAGGSVPTGDYRVRFSWIRQFLPPISFDIESQACPSSGPVTLTAGNQIIQFTIPARPGSLITKANIYISPVGGAAGTEGYVEQVSVSDSPTTYQRSASFTPGAAPPKWSWEGHGIVLDGCEQVAIDTPTLRDVPDLDARYILVDASKRVTLSEIRRLHGTLTPTYSVEIRANCEAVNFLNSNVPLAEVLDAQAFPSDPGWNKFSGRGFFMERLGVGTDAPLGKLHIAAMTGVAFPGSIALAIRDSGSPSDGFDFDLEGVSTGDLSLMRTISGAQSQVMTFQRATGNVGVGMANPQTQLDLQKAMRAGVNAVAFSATPTFDASLGNTQKITLTGNVTSSTLSNAQAGQHLWFIIIQDGTGGHTFAWPSNVKGGMTIGANPNEVSAQEFIFDGTNARAVTPGVVTT